MAAHMVAFVISIALVLPYVGALTESGSLIVNTTSGPARGISVLSQTSKSVYGWLGIPYAKTPTGDLRFRPPEPAGRWSGVFNATQLPNSCMQAGSSNTPLSEDCLYLSVWVPQPPPTGAAVMIWIHGGAFEGGSSTDDLYDPRILASENNVIVVGVQYRLAYFGFLYFGTEDVPGNVGMRDQTMAMKWVYDNIEAFGGDPDKITIFGQSAGSISVGMHLVSPLSRGLFSRAIMQSSVYKEDEILSREQAIAYGLALARAANCSDSGVVAAAACMRRVPAATLQSLASRQASLRPVVDGTFMLDVPLQSISSGSFNPADILAGSTSGDGFFLAGFRAKQDFLTSQENFTVNSTTFEKVVRELVIQGDNAAALDAIAFQYTGSLQLVDGVANRDALGVMGGDKWFSCPAQTVAASFSQAGNRAYLYMFSHYPSVHRMPEWNRANHGDDTQFVFGHPLRPQTNYTSAEVELSKMMMTLWTNFAKFGDPSQAEGSSVVNMSWPSYNTSSQLFLLLDTEPALHSASSFFKCAFWKEYLPALIADTTCDQPGPEQPKGSSKRPTASSAHPAAGTERPSAASEHPAANSGEAPPRAEETANGAKGLKTLTSRNHTFLYILLLLAAFCKF